ncbi:MaoC family dehydratase [Sphingomonas sp. CBMAI 2297]|nr:MaoC family dehydratase [Sphingomonas sp. CBMAI 2297]
MGAEQGERTAILATITVQQMAESIGTERVSDWVEVTQAMIDQFAEATGDHQFIHVDPVRAAQTPFGGTIAHGFLTLSLMPMLAARTDAPAIAGAKMGVNYGGNKVRFMQPVRSGKRVRGRFKLLKFTERKPGVWEQVQEYALEVEGEAKPALIAEWIALVYV